MPTAWLLDKDVYERMQQAQAAGVQPTAEQQAHFHARHGLDASSLASRILTISGSTARIEIGGVLTNVPDFFAMIFGGGNTTYPEVVAALAQAEADENVEGITLAIDSPGGAIDGLFDTLAAIKATSKHVEAFVTNLGASAAFAIAAQADEIVAANRMTRLGSVGIVASFRVSEDVVTVTSTKAPDKAPDVSTPEGVATVQKELDALHNVFVDEIAAGRGTTAKEVNANFGQGAVLLAEEAQKRGMIDSIAGPNLKLIEKKETVTDTGATAPGQSEATKMDLIELQAQHPAVFNEAKELGAKAERDRCVAHLTLGAASDSMDVAIKAVTEGGEMDLAAQTGYMAAQMNRADTTARADDDADVAAAADDTAAPAATPATDEEQVCGLVEDLMLDKFDDAVGA